MDKLNYVVRNNLFMMFDIDSNDNLNNYVKIINNCDTIFFDKKFNRDISSLPPSILTIIFNSTSVFNQEIKIFPYNLKKIVFGNKFNKSLEYFPDSLEQIEFCQDSEFNSDLSNLPRSLKKITLGKYFTRHLNCLPSELEYLKICSLYAEEIKTFPKKLKYLIFYRLVDNNYAYYEKKTICNIDNLPNELIEIRYPVNYNHPIKKLPQSLKIIGIDCNCEFLDELKSDFPNITLSFF